jgi:hypothetical protein
VSETYERIKHRYPTGEPYKKDPATQGLSQTRSHEDKGTLGIEPFLIEKVIFTL